MRGANGKGVGLAAGVVVTVVVATMILRGTMSATDTAASAPSAERTVATPPDNGVGWNPPPLKTGGVSSASPTDDAALMDQLRRIEDVDPARALEAARAGNDRFPKSPYAAERAMIVVKSLARQGASSEARSQAEAMVNEYPHTQWALEVEQHMGAHPHVSGGTASP